MDAQLKQRVVGAAVLVALFVIFIPMFLDDGGGVDEPNLPLEVEPEEPVDFSSRVVPLDDTTMDRLEQAMDAAPEELVAPEEGSAVAVPVPLDDEPAEGEQASSSEPIAGVTETEPQAEVAAAVQPVTEKASKPLRTGVTAWVVQLGSFTAEANATGLVERLKKDGYTAFIEPVNDAEKVSYRVRVGPELSEADADRVRDELAEKVKLKGIVMRYP